MYQWDANLNNENQFWNTSVNLMIVSFYTSQPRRKVYDMHTKQHKLRLIYANVTSGDR